MTTADYVLLAANLLIVIPLSVVTLAVLDSSSPFGMKFGLRTRVIVSGVIAAAAIWTFVIDAWPATIFLLLWLARRHLLDLWFGRRLGYRWTAALYAGVTFGCFALPLFLESQRADLAGRIALIILAALGLLLAYGVAIFLLRSLGGEYDRTPATTDVRPPR
ncbi:MAG TPA: hypothetical protein VGT60_08315 [Candidatus Limnocylindria bacterium]|nr:hypothetical protein [Candidatus Limnocylindria bacterium]